MSKVVKVGNVIPTIDGKPITWRTFPELQTKTLTLGSAAPQTVIPDAGKDGMSEVTVSIDSSAIKAENIKDGVSILGVEGEYALVINPLSVTANGTYTAPSGVDGYNPVTVNVVNPLLYASNIGGYTFQYNSSGGVELPSVFSLEFGTMVKDLGTLFYGAKMTQTTGSKVILKANGEITNLSNTFSRMNGGGYETIKLDFDTSHVTNWQSTFDSCTNLKTIIGILDFSSTTNVNYMFSYGNQYLEDMTWAENSLSTIQNRFDFDRCGSLTDASLISVANGLNESVTGLTIQFHTTPKAKLPTIMGTVVMDDTNTYHIFTADINGTITLENFITQIKGWTIA